MVHEDFAHTYAYLYSSPTPSPGGLAKYALATYITPLPTTYSSSPYHVDVFYKNRDGKISMSSNMSFPGGYKLDNYIKDIYTRTHSISHMVTLPLTASNKYMINGIDIRRVFVGGHVLGSVSDP